jgi:hypothetical protein
MKCSNQYPMRIFSFFSSFPTNKTVNAGCELFARKIYLLFIVSLCLVKITTVRAQITGKVFADFDANGLQTNLLPVELGMQGVQVRLFVGANSIPFVTQTDSLGAYPFRRNRLLRAVMYV